MKWSPASAMPEEVGLSVIFPYANLMYYLYYAGNIYGLCAYLFVIRYEPVVASLWRMRFTHHSMAIMVMNIFPFGYWFFLSMHSGTMPAQDYLVMLERYPHTRISVPLFMISCALHFFLSFMACGYHSYASDEETFEYITYKYGYSVSDLHAKLDPYSIKRFPVDAFEARLVQRNDSMVIPGEDRRSLVEEYLTGRLRAFDRTIARENNAQYRYDLAQYKMLTRLVPQHFPVLDNYCDYDKIRDMKAAKLKLCPV